ncbi:MAG: hypothetical protein ACPGUV_05640 [Polyangiales bacterium]
MSVKVAPHYHVTRRFRGSVRTERASHLAFEQGGKVACALIKARRAQVRQARGRLAPEVTAAAGVDYDNPNALFVPPPDGFRQSWNVGLA